MERRQVYLVEHYRPDVQLDELERSASRLRDAVEQMEVEGKPVRYKTSTIVPEDEYYLSVIEAASEALVREAHARAGVPFERISLAITVA